LSRRVGGRQGPRSRAKYELSGSMGKSEERNSCGQGATQNGWRPKKRKKKEETSKKKTGEYGPEKISRLLGVGGGKKQMCTMKVSMRDRGTGRLFLEIRQENK